MSLFKDSVRKLKSGFTLGNEYLCINQHELIADIKVLLTWGRQSIDVTFSHLLLGYKPVIIAIPSSQFQDSPPKCNLNFYTNDFLCGTIALVRSELQHSSVTIYQGISGKAHLLTTFQKTIQAIKQLRKDKSHSLYPTKDSYNQIRIAYSFPRKISIIILERNNSFNIFPTDLHGEISGQSQYMISLRENGKAYEQVSESDTISLSKVSSKNFRVVYALGKNHMKEMASDPELINLVKSPDKDFSHYAYKGCNECLSLRKINEIKVGIHYLITFSLSDKIIFTNNEDTLSHIHEYYALWRKRHNFKDRLLIRP